MTVRLKLISWALAVSALVAGAGAIQYALF
jgi:hypothetical protein